jgi:hypothetical protein
MLKGETFVRADVRLKITGGGLPLGSDGAGPGLQALFSTTSIASIARITPNLILNMPILFISLSPSTKKLVSRYSVAPFGGDSHDF